MQVSLRLWSRLPWSNICCSFFWGKFLKDEEISETRATDYRILRIGFEIIEKSMKLKFLRTSLNQSNICCSFFGGKFLQDEIVSETSAKYYGISRTGTIYLKNLKKKYIKGNLIYCNHFFLNNKLFWRLEIALKTLQLKSLKLWLTKPWTHLSFHRK